MPLHVSRAAGRRSRVPALLAAVLLPPVVFYAYLFHMALDVPWLDDYDAGLNFASQLVRLPSFSQRLLYFAAAQHNEYKIYLGHALVWLELAITGRVHFALLSGLGNLSLLLLAGVLWTMFLPGTPLQRRLALFVPVSLLLFQYQYVETLNWPLPAVQNLPVVGLAFAAIVLLDRGGRRAFTWAVLAMVLGIASSGNGFLIVAVGLLLLALRRSYLRLTLWLVVAAACAWVYRFHYRPTPKPIGVQPSPLHLNPVYLLGFLGAAGRYPVLPGAILLGVALCVFFVWMVRRGELRRQPAVAYCLLFVLLTGIGVMVIRAGLGLAQSVSSRYRIYSDLLLIFAWFMLVGRFGLARIETLRRSRLYLSGLVAAALFCVSMDAIGVRSLRIRDQRLKIGMANFEHSAGRLPPTYEPEDTSALGAYFAEHTRQVLLQAEKDGVYQPPPY